MLSADLYPSLLDRSAKFSESRVFKLQFFIILSSLSCSSRIHVLLHFVRFGVCLQDRGYFSGTDYSYRKFVSQSLSATKLTTNMNLALPTYYTVLGTMAGTTNCDYSYRNFASQPLLSAAKLTTYMNLGLSTYYTVLGTMAGTTNCD